MLKISALNLPQVVNHERRQRRVIIAEWGPDRFASGMKTAVAKALEIGPKRAGIMDQLLLWTLSLR